MSDEEKLVSHYRLKTALRKDGFGAVYLSEDTRDQKECILRVIELDQATLRRITGRVRAHSQRDHPLIEQIRQRMKRIAELKNSHILPVIEFGEEHIQGNNDIIFYMVSPYEKESLLSYWSARTSVSELISLEIILEIVEQAAEALYYVHRRGLVHQYVRLSSFMLRSSSRSRKMHLYLTDFWFADITAHLLEEGQISQDLSVYLASEQLAGKPVAASDQYALALMIYELLLGYRLSSVDLSLGLYESALRQRSVEVSEADLALARRLDLVLRRALAEDASARYQNIDVFASTFRAALRGEAIELLEEDTARLPVIGQKKGSHAGEAAVAGAGALAAGAIIAGAVEGQAGGTVESEAGMTAEQVEVTESQAEVIETRGELVESRGDQGDRGEIEESTRTRRPGLHKTVLTSAGMEATAEITASGEVLEATTLSQQETLTSVQRETLISAEETLTTRREETAGGSIVAGGAGFAAGLAAGEVLQSEVDLASERASSAEIGTAAFAAGEISQRERDRGKEERALAEGAAAGLLAGEALQSERDRRAQEQARSEGAAAGLLAGELLQSELDRSKEERARSEGTAAGLLAGEVLQREVDLSEEQRLRAELAEESRRIAASSAAAFAAGAAAGAAEQRELDREAEQTRQRQSAEAGFAAGAVAGFAAGEAYERQISAEEEQTIRRESSAEGFVAGAAAGAAAGLAAGEGLVLAQEIDIAEQQTQIIEASGGAAVAGGATSGGTVGSGETGTAGATSGQETDISAEKTQIIPAVGGVVLGAAAGLLAGELLAGEAGAAGGAGTAGAAGAAAGGVAGAGTGAAGGVAGGVIGGVGQAGGGMAEGGAASQAGGEGSGTGASSVGQTGGAAGLVGGAAIAGAVAGGVAGAGAAGALNQAGGATGLAGGIEQTQAGGVAGAVGQAGGATGLAGAGLAGAGLAASGYAGTQQAMGGEAGQAGGIEKTQEAGGAAGLAGAGLAGAGLAGAGFAASGYSSTQQKEAGAGVAAGGGIIGGGVAGGGTGAGVLPLPASGRRRRRGRNWLLAAIIAVLLFFILGGGVLVFALNSTYSATVTITRESHTISNSYTVTATTSTTTTGGQIQAVRFTQSASLHKSGQSTGYYQGSYSTGFIRFYNSSTGCGCPVVIPAGTTFTGASGVTVVTDEAASVASLCYVTVHAHAVIVGPGGDIPAQDIEARYSSTITATNPFAFGGGQTGQNNVIVQQSDIDHLAKSLQAQVIQSAQAGIQTQLQSNQHLFAQPDCHTKVKSDHAAGDYAASFTVTVSALCTAEAYDYSAAVKTVTQQFQAQASSYSNDEYVLVGGLQTSVTGATVTDARAGTLLLFIRATGRLIRKLTGDLASTIKGQSARSAVALLKQLGAATVKVSFSIPNKDTLPDDPSRIKIVLAN